MEELYQPVIVRKELDDQHYYYVDEKFTPAVTTILSETLPMSLGLKNWIGDVGNEKAQMKMEKAAERGTAIHEACEKLILGEEINLEKDFPERQDKKVLVGFINWFVDYQPKPLKNLKPEYIVASKLGFAGTVDYPCMINNLPYVVDFKTSKSVSYDSYKLQLVAYKHAIYEMTGIECRMGILHLTPMTKKGYSFIDDDRMEIKKKKVEISDFLAVLNLYKVLNGGQIPEPDLTEIYPPIIKLERK